MWLTIIVGMYIAAVPNRSSPPAILLRESRREGKKVKTRTLANLTDWPAEKVGMLRRVLAGDTLVAPGEALVIERSLPHGHVLAVLGALRKLELDRLIAAKESRERKLVLAMIVARIIDPRSKLATARGLDDETAFSTLAEKLDVANADADELYAAMDWLLERQSRIEKKLAQPHLKDGALVLYDVSSTYFEGRCCPPAKRGYRRDGKKDKLQIVFGLLCNAEGCPVSVEVFEGNTADPKTLSAQVRKVKERFGLTRVVWVGDRGMITEARIEAELRGQDGLDWITALRAPAIRRLVEQKTIQMSLFDERDLAEITSPDYPDERLIACRNPLPAEERKRTRGELIAATEKKLDAIVKATRRTKNPLRGADQIGLRVGKVLPRFKVGKYFTPVITESSFSYERHAPAIAADEAIDGIYVLRTSVKAVTLNAERTVEAYKNLSVAERAFRSYKTVDLKVRPIHHRLSDRVRAHVFLCMLAYYVEWHMRQALAPLLFDDEDKPAAKAARASIVAPAQRSATALRKASTRRTTAGQPAADASAAQETATLPVHSFQTLLADLATLTRNRVRFPLNGSPSSEPAPTTTMLAQPTALQQRAFDLLGLASTL
jgi:transposase